jgi:hypothetical protein
MMLFDSAIDREEDGTTTLGARNNTSHTSKRYEAYQTISWCFNNQLQTKADGGAECSSQHADEDLPVPGC